MRRKYWRPAMVAATAILSAVALVVALNAESSTSTTGSRLGADSVLASPTIDIPTALHTVAPKKKKPKPKPKPKPKHTVSSSTSEGTLNDEAMPTGNLPGWKLTYSTDFPGNSLPSGWGAYTGEPGGDPQGYWEPQDVSVSGGELHLTTTPGNDPDDSGVATTGGVSYYGGAQTYGMYLVRMKSDYEPGLDISNIALLWPADNSWPPEIDFYEDDGGTRNNFNTTLHSGTDDNDCCVVHKNDTNNGTQWHTYGVEWTANSIVYTVDGREWGSLSNDDDAGGTWPDIPMILDLQSENLGDKQPSGSIETMTVAWVAEYAPD